MASNKVSRLNLHQLWSFSAALIRCMRTSRSKAAPFANIDRACQFALQNDTSPFCPKLWHGNC